jgi:hypothetical protein
MPEKNLKVRQQVPVFWLNSRKSSTPHNELGMTLLQQSNRLKKPLVGGVGDTCPSEEPEFTLPPFVMGIMLVVLYLPCICLSMLIYDLL